MGYDITDTVGGVVTSATNVVAYAAAGHQGRLFVSNGNEVRYSGTGDDLSSGLSGINYWDENSVFQVAPELGSRIEKMISFGGDLYFLKDKGIAVMRGAVANGDPTKFGASVDVITDGLGCMSYTSAVLSRMGIILWTNTGIYLIYFHVGVYEFQSSVSAERPVYAVWDMSDGSWSYRSYRAELAPGCAAELLDTDGETMHVTFPYANNGKYGTVQSGTECFKTKMTVPAGCTEKAGTDGDLPAFSIITCAAEDVEDDGLYHIRARDVYTIYYRGAGGTASYVAGVITGNSLLPYGIDIAASDIDTYGAGGNFSAYTLSDSTSIDMWRKAHIDTDRYGFSKMVAIYNDETSTSDNETDVVFIQGIILQYDKSEAIP
jgi:hypothetical protein